VNRRARRILDAAREPFFLYLHYLDPHDPYAPPAGAARPWAGSPAGPDFIREGRTAPIFDMLYEGGPLVEVSPADLRHLSDLYDEEVLFLDRELARLLAELRARQLLDRTILVVAADHGEEFLDHEHIQHCSALYQASIHVPLMLRIPGQPPARHAAVVENTDLVPTLLELLGVPRPAGLEGISLRALLEGRPGERRYAFSVHGSLRSVRDERYKLILDVRDGRTALYDLQRDPGEHNELGSRQPRERDRLAAALIHWRARHGDTAPVDLDEIERALRAIGYLR
jgi:arylsulfatase A-like enzyme